MNKIKNKILSSMIALMFVLIFVPSISNAASKEVLTINYNSQTEKFMFEGSTTSYKGDKKNPVILDMKYDEIIFNFSANGKIENSFFYTFKNSNPSQKYGKYMVNIYESESKVTNEKEKKILFKRLATTDILGAYSVTPPKKDMGSNYVQPGAMYNDASSSMGHTMTLYKITAHMGFKYNKGGWFFGYPWAGYDYMLTVDLGNSTIATGTVAANAASHPQVYVFSESGLKENELILFSSLQQSSQSKIDFKNVDDNNKLLRYKVTGPKTMSTSDGKKSYTFDDKEAQLVYEFVGLTSEILDNNENTTIEKIIATVAISVGDLFRGVINMVGGKNLTLDSLIFNQYPNTVLDFWKTDKGGKYADVFQMIINGWYKAFSAWTQMILVVVLIAMGIKTMMLSGSSKQKKIQNMLVGWVLAIALLFFGPYFMKYAITMNDMLVKIFRDNSEYSVFSVYNTDFIERFDISEDVYQYGEDSTTKSIKEQLMKMRDVIEKKYAESQDEWEKAQMAVESSRGTFAFWNMVSKEIRIVDSTMISRRMDIAVKEVENYIEQNQTLTDQQITDYVNHMVNDVIIEWYWGTQTSNFIFLNKEYVKSKIEDYAFAYYDYKSLEGALEDVERAIELSSRGIDLEGTMRDRAGTTKRLVFVAVWYIMMYQLVLLLFLYYKRLVVVGVLITIFPLVVMMYAIEKLMGIEKSQTFSTWVKEYLVNVFIQSVHAFLYVMLVETGLKIYEADSDNWLLFLFAVMAIFPMESIIKAIIGMKASTVSSLKDSAVKGGKYALVAYGASKVISGNKAIDSKYDAKDAKAQEKEAKQDQRIEFRRNLADNIRMRRMAGGGNHADSQARLAQIEAKRQEADERRKKRRKAAQNVRNIRRNAEKVMQPLRNVAAVSSMITTGLAGGGDVGDFAAGMAVANVISGKNRKVTDVKKENSSSASTSGSSAPTGQDRNRYANSNGQTRGTAPNTGNRAADQARQETEAADYGNGRMAPTAGEARAAARAQRNQSGIQDRYRQGIANRAEVQANQDIFYNHQDEG
ncbi:MAG: hypothetical protein IJX99_04310 [Clostridia bacterium]|nr:hypothetical protein [Clostridia bacterium]